MSFEKQQRVEYVLELIEKKQCSTPQNLASRFNVSKRTIRRYIDNLRNKGYDIRYSRLINRYEIIENED